MPSETRPTPPPFLDRLPAGDAARVRARMRVQRHPAGAELMAADTPGDEMFVILEGRVGISLFAPDGREVSYRDAGPGDLIGELALIDGRPRSASVIARDPVCAGWLGRADLTALLGSSPDFAMELLRHLAVMLRDNTDRVFAMSTLPVRERLLREVLRRARAAAGAPGAEVRLQPAPTHYELATRIGTHREAISRELSRLAREGLVRREGRVLIVTSVEALAARAE